MKKIYLFIVLLVGLGLNAQVINFEDANFKNKLLSANSTNQVAKNLEGNYFKIDANSNGEIEVSEAIQVSYLDISVSSISSMEGILYFTSLQNLNCKNFGSVNWNLLTQINLSGLSNLEVLNCNQNYQLALLNISGCSNLTNLSCSSNNLGMLNLQGFNNLESLDCSGSNLTSLNLNGLTNLTTVDCCCNFLTTLDVSSCVNLTSLNCYNNGNMSTLLINGLSNLSVLVTYLNDLTSLNLTGCSNLTELNCWGNQLTSLDISGLENLLYLNVWQNDLTSLFLNGCFNIENIDCSENNLTSLDLTGLQNLEILNCRYNNLVSLDVSLQEALTQLNCSFNQITSIDVSNNHLLDNLQIHDNDMIYMNIKNGISIYNGGIYNNPNISYVCCDDIEISFVEDSFVNQNVSINSYCSFTPGGEYFTIQGNSKFDSNSGGCEVTDPVYNHLKINVTNSSNAGIFILNETGSYSIPVQDGNHTLTPILENPTYFNINPASFSVTFPGVSPYLQDFCVTPNGIHNDVEVTIITLLPARPGFDATYKVVFKNKGNTILSGSVTFEFEDNKMDLISSVPNFSIQATGLLTYDYLNLQPFETREVLVTLNINSPQESPAVNIGDQLNFTAIINPLTGDEFLFDNTSNLKQTVVGSYDPNDKTCIEGDVVGPEMIGQYVHYVIRFENTGTFPAENVVVKDMIDLTKFDLGSLIPTSSSHSFVTRIGADGKVEFIFENIQLPFDDVNNDGYIAFKIKTLPSLVVGDTFSNNANIYFDYNFPIETNTTSTTIQTLGNSDFNFGDYLRLYPNPAKSVLNIKMNSEISITSINIYNSLGQLVLVTTNPSEGIDVSSLKTGSYFIKVISDKGISTTQFLKQ